MILAMLEPLWHVAVAQALDVSMHRLVPRHHASFKGIEIIESWLCHDPMLLSFVITEKFFQFFVALVLQVIYELSSPKLLINM